MSNRHRKRTDPKPKPTIEEFIGKKLTEIQALFPDIHMRATLVLRYPQDPNAEIVFSDDQIDHVIAVMQRRRDALVAAQKPPPWTRDDTRTETCLLLVSDEHTTGPVTLERIGAWSDAECEAVEAYCMAIHYSASDNEGVEIPPKPECLSRG